MPKRLRALVACEFSGRVRDALAAVGYDAWSCDLLDTERPGQHVKGDVRLILGDGWDLLIAHPPCTRLAKSGVFWLHRRPALWADLDDAAAFFKELLDAPIPHVAVENPVVHRYAVERIGRKHDQVVHPWWFGHPVKKATCLWLRGLPLLRATKCVDGKTGWLEDLGETKDRWKARSRTFDGFAQAMAWQWNPSVLRNELKEAA